MKVNYSKPNLIAYLGVSITNCQVWTLSHYKYYVKSTNRPTTNLNMIKTNATHPPNGNLNLNNTPLESRTMILPRNLRQISLSEKVPILLALCKIKMLQTNYKIIVRIKSITSKTLINTNILLTIKIINNIGITMKKWMTKLNKQVTKRFLQIHRIFGLKCKINVNLLNNTVLINSVIIKLINENEIKKYLINLNFNRMYFYGNI